jgi:riboflavin synthase
MFSVLAGAETLARTTLGQLRIGKRVNLERAARRRPARGHWVTGHIDGTGELARGAIRRELVLAFRATPALLRQLVEKGSIAIAGGEPD